jgi:hypothetical protein
MHHAEVATTHLQRDGCLVTVIPISDSTAEITVELGDQKLRRNVPAHLSRSDSQQFFQIIQRMKAELWAEHDRSAATPDRPTGVQPGILRSQNLRRQVDI